MAFHTSPWRMRHFLLPTITLLTLCTTHSVSSENITEYEWDIGGWESCVSPSGCGEGRQRRKIDCVFLLDGTVVASPNCDDLQKPVSTKSCFLFCDTLKPYLRWSIGLWSKCHHRKHRSTNCSYSGISHRTVKCLYKGTESRKTVPDSACEKFWSRPEERTPCSQECPQDCLVSEGSCKDNVQCTAELQGSIIVAPEPGGLRCSLGNVSQCNQETCPQETTFAQYTLKVSDWGPCIPMNCGEDEGTELSGLSLEPKIGKTTRVMSCHDRTGRKVNISHCSDAASERVQQQRCLVPKDCEMSPWSEWTVTVEGCVNSRHQIFPERRIRIRKLVTPALGNGAPCGPLYEERTVRMNLPQCYKYQWFPLDWKECVVYNHKDLNTIEVLQPTCGGGVQVRDIICLQISDSVPVESLCVEPKPPTVQRCEIPCVRDCQVSHWSKWGSCLPYGSMTDFNKPIQKGYQMRTRSVIISLSSGGASCPHLQEIDSCSDVSVAKWIYGNWSDCHLLDRSSPCGPGEKTRDYSCVTFKGAPISEIFCEKHASYRKTTEACRVPCPDDCTLSEWSEWSTCPSTCSDDDDEFHIHRNRTSLAIKGPDGSSCHLDRKESKACVKHSCSLTRWSASEWDDCDVHDGSICGYGIQRRTVTCQIGDIHLKNDSSCTVMDKPVNSRPCEKHCPEDCILTNFTEWSSCPVSCSSGANQRRRRFLQRPAKYGGRSCPLNLSEERPCPAANDVMCNLQSQATYQFLMGSWSSCTLPDINSTCGAGFQFRAISCVDDAGELVEMHHCLSQHNNTADVINFITAIPSTFRLCQITCRDGQPSCVHSAWTSWSSCPYKYKAKKTRTRELVGSSSSDQYCVDRFTLIEQEDCPFLDGELTMSQTSWSSCILEDSNRTTVAVNDQNIFHHCGAGYRYKTGLQVKDVDVIEPGLERDLCLIDCPVDCTMSEWSEWSDCDVSCGHGYKQRKRKIVVPANGLGRPCPSECRNGTETQQDVCEIPCNGYHWLNYGWSKCELLVRDLVFKKCGNGTQARTVECISKITEKKVDPEHCDPILKPREFQLCSVSCPGECIVSDWSIWTDCSQPCQHTKTLEKRRIILRNPASPMQCPELVTKENCVLNGNCFEYKWEFGEWASCILPEGAVCGEGVQRRVLLCRRSDGRQVDTINCKKVEESPSLKHELSKPCLQDCPIDCVMSHWSPWDDSQCTNHCGTAGMMTRSRSVLQPSSESGQPCSYEMEQKKPCPFKPCYHWKTFDWSKCDLQGASCGYGVRRRLVRCIRYDGLQVDKIHCLASNLTFGVRGWLGAKWLTLAHDKAEEEDCYVRCPGDCILSQWSIWGHCHKDCDGGQKVGYQTSSRTLMMPATSSQMRCPTKMWKTKPCWGGECTTFKWKYENDTLICITSEGIIVKGGCKNLPRPCFKSCELLPGGKCNTQKGTCFCKGDTGRWIPVPFANAGRRKCNPSPPKPIMGPKQPANHTAEINRKYYPDDSQVSFWMYAMISIGSAFVIFVVVTIYLMCSNGGQST